MLDPGLCVEFSSHLAELLNVNQIESFPFRNLHVSVNEIHWDHTINAWNFEWLLSSVYDFVTSRIDHCRSFVHGHILLCDIFLKNYICWCCFKLIRIGFKFWDSVKVMVAVEYKFSKILMFSWKPKLANKQTKIVNFPQNEKVTLVVCRKMSAKYSSANNVVCHLSFQLKVMFHEKS